MVESAGASLVFLSIKGILYVQRDIKENKITIMI